MEGDLTTPSPGAGVTGDLTIAGEGAAAQMETPSSQWSSAGMNTSMSSQRLWVDFHPEETVVYNTEVCLPGKGDRDDIGPLIEV